MRIGLHVSISGSIDMAITNAINRECSAFQIFTRNPRSWFAKDLDMKDAEKYVPAHDLASSFVSHLTPRHHKQLGPLSV